MHLAHLNAQTPIEILDRFLFANAPPFFLTLGLQLCARLNQSELLEYSAWLHDAEFCSQQTLSIRLSQA